MKKDLQKLIVLMAIMFIPFVLFSQEYGNVLNESFENGIPQEWMQEKISGEIDWIVESGELVRPSGAFDGDKRVAFRNITGVTTKSKTRLITPVLDISKLYQPILVFAHAQSKWTDDFDTLKIFYRTAPEKEWVELKVFDRHLAKWQMDTVQLGGATSTYQIAFEATDNLGRGVVIDDVQVRSTPNCIAPYGFALTNVKNTSATLEWLGAFDAESFQLKVSTTRLSATELADESFVADVLDKTLSDVWEYLLEGLEPGAKYYYYMRSNCAEESSIWVEDSLSTVNFLELPYSYDFKNHVKTPNYVTYPVNWFLGATGEKPYVNTNYTGTQLEQYSPDTSYVLCFAGKKSSLSADAIPGGQYAYAALQPVNIERIQDLEVSFETLFWTAYTDRTFKIIVGVMSDPNVKASFVAVDTIEVTETRLLQRHVVSLENYDGEGKHIAFMSDFLEPNLFRLDNVKVDFRKAVGPVTFEVKIPSASSIKLDFNEVYDKYEVLVSATRVDANVAIPTNPLFHKEVADLEEISNMPSASDIFVYARGVKGSEKGIWSFPTPIHMPAKIDAYPYLVDFEINKEEAATYYRPWYNSFPYSTSSTLLVKELTVKGAVKEEVPEVTKDYANVSNKVNLKQRSTYELTATAYIAYKGQYCAAIFPEMQDVKNTRVAFWAAKHSKTQQSAFSVGLMSDANDISTYTPIDTIYPDFKYSYYIYDLDQYSAEGKFFVIYVDDMDYLSEAEGGSNNFVYMYVDDVEFSEIPRCKNPYTVEVKSYEEDPSIAKFSWDANGAKEWTLRISEYPYSSDSLDVATNKFVYNQKLTTNTVDVKGLDYPGKKYYYWFKATCDAGDAKWSEIDDFTTKCPDVHPVPYEEDFDKAWYSIEVDRPGFTVPDMITKQHSHTYMSVTTYFPYLSTYKTASGDKSMYFGKSSSWYPKGTTMYVAMPKMAADVNKLQLSFSMWNGHLNNQLAIGVMSDPMDTTTFELDTVITPTETLQWKDHIVTFENYSGKGEYIAMMAYGSSWTSNSYIDDVVVDLINACKRPEQVEAENIGITFANVKWQSEATMHKVVVSTKRLTKADLLKPQISDSVVFIETVNSNPYKIEGLSANTIYYLYIQAQCSEGSVSAWSNPIMFRTDCELLDSYELGVENFDTYGTGAGKYPTCYIVGNKTAETTAGVIPQCGTAWKHSGSASLYFNTTTKNPGAYAITPEIDITDISMLRLNLWGSAHTYVGSEYAKSLVVGVITDPSDLGTFIAVDTLEFSSEALPYEVLFDKYLGDADGNKGRYVMFLSEFALANKVFIDDVVFDTIPACRADIEVVEVTGESVTIVSDKARLPYQLKYATTMSDEEVLNGETLKALTIDKDTIVIEGLESNTSYYFYARPTCGEGYGNWSNVVVATTDCPTKFVLPFYEDFEANPVTGTKINPVCWNSYYTKASTDYPSINSAANQGERSTYLYAKNESSTPYLVSQAIDVDALNKCQVSFYVRPNGTSVQRSVIVGVVSDLANIAGTFEPVDTILLNRATNEFSKHVVLLDEYEGTGKYIAFATYYSLNLTAKGKSTASGVYLDDVMIELIPACTKPDFFEYRSVTDHSLDFGFTHPGAVKYEVKYGEKGFAVETAGQTKEITTTEFVIEGLAAETTYDVYVRAYCSATEMSPWSFVGTYTTTATVYDNYPYNCDFSSNEETSYWRFAQEEQPNQWIIGCDDANMVNNGDNNGGKALYISKDGGATANYRANVDEEGVVATSRSYAYMALNLEPGVYTISYDWTCFGEGTKDFVRAGLLPTTSTFAAGENKVKAADGTSVNMTYTVATQPKDWVELSEESTSDNCKLNLVDTTLALADQWNHATYIIDVDEELAGIYHLLFYWVNDASSEVQYSERGAVIDNVVINKAKCNRPQNAELVIYDHQSAQFKWEDLISPAVSYNLLLAYEEVDPDTAHKDQIAIVKNVATQRATIEGLSAGVKYYAYVQSVCSEADKSMWVGPIAFTSLCEPVAVNTMFDFDDENEHFVPTYIDGTLASTSYMQPNCFVTSHDTLEFNKSNVARYPYLKKNTATYKYSRSGDYALYFERTNNTTHPGGIIALPAVEGDIETMQLTFWMRAAYEKISTNKTSTVYTADKYAKRITVGTMIDPNDPSTFVAIDTLEYTKTPKTSSVVTDDEDGYWVEMNVLLKGAVGRYVAFKNESYDKTSNYLFIDDVVISSATCMTPNSVDISSITSASAVINATHGESAQFEIAIATDLEFTTNLRYDTVTALPATINNLTPATRYYVKVRSLCSAQEVSDWSLASYFTTVSVISYSQDFSYLGYCPTDWKRVFSSAGNPILENVLDKPYEFTYGASDATGTTWASKAATFSTGYFSTRHMASKFGSDYKGWLLSPAIELPTGKDLHLVFDLALTSQGSDLPINDEDRAYTDDRFAVAISTDGGISWTRENTTIWGHTDTDEHRLYDISSTGEQIEMNMTKYAGKIVKIGFYVQSEFASAKMDIHLDNVHINAYEKMPITQTICQTEDYEDEVFELESSDLVVGENKFEKMEVVQDESDIYHSLSLNVIPMITNNIEASLCEGDVYAKNNFSGLMEPGVYKQKLTAANGCDSVVILNLSITPIARTTFFDTICYGNSVIWNGKEYDRTGIYADTLASKVTGCDSIVMFVLKVNDAIRSEEYVNICFGDTYLFGEQTISATGKYEATFKTASGCDSIVTLHATVLPDYRKTINAVIKEGQEYSENGFVGIKESGTYPLTLKSVDDCDSTITLNLKVLSDVTTEDTVILCFGDSYQFGDTLITESGQYVEVFKTVEGTDSTVILTATVLPDYRQTIKATICSGEVYNENGFENLSATGVYKQELKSVDGCDSTITLNLTVLSGDTTRVEFEITTDDLPYEYQSLYYDETTKPGTYVDTIYVEAGDCQDVIVHTLVVTQGVAVDDVRSYDLVMYPMPLTAGHTLYLSADFSLEEREGMIVEVFNAIGQCVYVAEANGDPISITGLNERGVYVVRIISGTGDSYQGKVVVK